MRSLPFAVLLALFASCATVTGVDHVTIRSSDGESIGMGQLAEELRDADVVFLGEEHDSKVTHRLQLELTQRLSEMHGGVALSLEMFERDAQGLLDLFLDGTITEEAFLGLVRTWSNHADDYQPAIRYAAEEGLRVIAANCYRPIASTAAKVGWRAAIGSPWAALRVDASPGAYRDRFFQSMADIPGHGSGFPEDVMQRFYEAQCLKDDTMAESIARYFDEHGNDAPPVVHWCGRFHSDYGLGTVERLRERRPDLVIRVVSSIKSPDLGRSAPSDDRTRAGHLWYVRP